MDQRAIPDQQDFPMSTQRGSGKIGQMQASSDAQEASLALGLRVALLDALFLCSGPSAEKSGQALPHREFSCSLQSMKHPPANNERMQWARDYWMALHAYSAGGGYVNMMMVEGTDNVKAAYRDNYARLAQIKATYDPSNLFHVNQHIKFRSIRIQARKGDPANKTGGC